MDGWAYEEGERRAKTRRSPSLMSSRTLQPSHVILGFCGLDSDMVTVTDGGEDDENEREFCEGWRS